MSAGFTLRSEAFQEGATIPRRHTCDGDDVSPPLRWEGAPPETASFALIVHDPDAGGFVHWVAFDLPGGPGGELAEGASGSGTLQEASNDFGRAGYGGPCPPRGVHRYVFTLYALSGRLSLGATATADQVRGAMANLRLDAATLTAVYERATQR